MVVVLLSTQEKGSDLEIVCVVLFLRSTLYGRRTSCQKHLREHQLSYSCCNLIDGGFIRSAKSNSCAVLTAQNTTESNSIDSHPQDTTVFQRSVFKCSTPVTNRKHLTITYPSQPCQDHRQSLHSITLLVANCNFLGINR